MSFILDALKKSEAERQRQAGPALLEMRVTRPKRRVPAWVWIAGGALLLVNGVVIGLLVNRQSAAPAVAASPIAITSPPAAAPTTTPVQSPVPAASGSAPPWNNATSDGSADRAVPQYQTRPGEIDTEAPNPADFEPAAQPAGGATVSIGRTGDSLRNYSEVGGNVPELRLDLHVYAAKSADRYAYINMHKVKEGDITAEGARVLEITRDGVVLSYRNSEFLLGRE